MGAMTRAKVKRSRLVRDDRGASTTEYALMLALVIVAGVFGYRAIGGKAGAGGGNSTSAFSSSGVGAARGSSGAQPPPDRAAAGHGGSPGSADGAKAASSGGASQTVGTQDAIDEPSGTGGMLKIIGAIVGGFFVLGIYFVFRNAKRGAPS